MNDPELNKEFEVIINGFTKSFEEELSKPKSKLRKIDVDNIIDMPTFTFASIAFKNNAPLKLIKVIEEMKNRYSKAKYFNKKVYGFLLNIEGRAYSYLALNCKNSNKKRDLISKAEKCFDESFNNYHCIESKYDKARLAKGFNKESLGALWIMGAVKDEKEKYTTIGYLYQDLYTLANNALRAIQEKRVIVENEMGLDTAQVNFQLGMRKNSVTSALSYGLYLIAHGDKEKGMNLVKENYQQAKEIFSKYEDIMFASDYKIYKEGLEIIEKNIINIRTNNRK